ncbi:MAG: hypothetical protein JKY10_10860 [Cohaesibacteraceae bacterium]|nr:hypothetical protein [Cohaesibacteraceae bacterium]
MRFSILIMCFISIVSFGGAVEAAGEKLTPPSLPQLSKFSSIAHLQDMALARERDSDWRGALDYWKQAIAVDPVDLTTLRLAIRAARLASRAELAKTWAQQYVDAAKAIKNSPSEHIVLGQLELARILFDAGQVKAANIAYSEALPKFKSGDLPVYTKMVHLSRYALGLAHFKNPEGKKILQQIHGLLGDSQFLPKSIEDAVYALDIGRMLEAYNDFDNALLWYRAALLQLERENIRDYGELARAHEGMARMQNALKNPQQVEFHTNVADEIRINLIVSGREKMDHPGRLDHLGHGTVPEVTDLDYSDLARMHYLAAMAHETNGDFGKAEIALNNAVKALDKPRGISRYYLAEIHSARARVNLGKGDFIKAMEAGTEAIQLYKHYGANNSALAVSYARLSLASWELTRGNDKKPPKVVLDGITDLMQKADVATKSDLGLARLKQAEVLASTGYFAAGINADDSLFDYRMATYFIREMFGEKHPVTLLYEKADALKSHPLLLRGKQ